MSKVNIYIDGTCLGNPGKAGIGVIFYDERGHEICELSHYLGDATNNIAEYQALISALQKAREIRLDNLFIYTDSELLARQINGFYKVRDKKLKSLYSKAKQLITNFKSVRIRYISREKNKYADKLAWQAIQQIQDCITKGAGRRSPRRYIGEESPGSKEQDALSNQGVALGDMESATENTLPKNRDTSHF